MDLFKFLDYKQLIYTPFYCEENIWKLCEHIQQKEPELLKNCFVVFISNDIEKVLLWAQKIGNPDHNYHVIWDYHVILIYYNTDDDDDDMAVVFDYDTILPFPCSFNDYQNSVLRRYDYINSKYDCKFRIIMAEQYLRTFSSDRSRMKDSNGKFIQPPPEYPCIQTSTESNNLNDFISMNMQTFCIGQVMDLDQLRKKFSK
ncbi:hypothetical protein HUG17_5316 [Dermatophagoides farinae]|uniref:Protein N-terminal glutamine amidohydrolase n=2 Tax=Dermatophagoides farinae TaxID=6954 RepID=A0A9D4P1A4_DERFA|nr:hypothetical protein HUG17_5316 [Dermatophagoides farinae]